MAENTIKQYTYIKTETIVKIVEEIDEKLILSSL